MAQRLALRELQSRLAERLQAAQAHGNDASWLAVRMAQQGYLLPLAQAGEIFPLGVVRHVPYTKSWFRGVTSLRGGLFGVVDFAEFISGAAVSRSELVLAQASVVTLAPVLDVNCALLVDGLAGLRKSDAFRTSERAGAADAAYWGTTWIDAQGERWREVNLLALSQMPEFLHITAAVNH